MSEELVEPEKKESEEYTMGMGKMNNGCFLRLRHDLHSGSRRLRSCRIA